MRNYLKDGKVLLLIFLIILRLNVSLWGYINSKIEDLVYNLNLLNKLKQISSQKEDIEKFFKQFSKIEKKNCSLVLRVSSENQMISSLEEKFYRLMKVYKTLKFEEVKWETVSKDGNVYILPLKLKLKGNPENVLDFWCTFSRNIKSLEVKEFYFSFKNFGVKKGSKSAVLKLFLKIFAVDNRFCKEDRVE